MHTKPFSLGTTLLRIAGDTAGRTIFFGQSGFLLCWFSFLQIWKFCWCGGRISRLIFYRNFVTDIVNFCEIIAWGDMQFYYFLFLTYLSTVLSIDELGQRLKKRKNALILIKNNKIGWNGDISTFFTWTYNSKLHIKKNKVMDRFKEWNHINIKIIFQTNSYDRSVYNK